MKHILLRTTLLTILSLTVTAARAERTALYPDAPVAIEGVEQGEPAMTIKGKSIHVQNAAGHELEVYDITGKLVSSIRIDSNDKTLTLSLSKGVYVVKVDKLTGKVIVR